MAEDIPAAQPPRAQARGACRPGTDGHAEGTAERQRCWELRQECAGSRCRERRRRGRGMETLRWGEGLRPGCRPSQVCLGTALPTSEPLAVPTPTPSPGCFGSAPGRAGQGSVPPRGDPGESSPGRQVQPVKGTSGPGVKWSSLGPGPQLVWHSRALPWSLSGPPPAQPPLPVSGSL